MKIQTEGQKREKLRTSDLTSDLTFQNVVPWSNKTEAGTFLNAPKQSIANRSGHNPDPPQSHLRMET